VVIETPGGVGYEVVVPLGVMERLPATGAEITLSTELVVREDGWALYGFLDEAERRFFQRLTSVSGGRPQDRHRGAVGPGRGARRPGAAREEHRIAFICKRHRPQDGRTTGARAGEKVEEFTEAPSVAVPVGAEAALKALERLGYAVPEADRAIRQALAGNGTETETETLVRRALQILTTR